MYIQWLRRWKVVPSIVLTIFSVRIDTSQSWVIGHQMGIRWGFGFFNFCMGHNGGKLPCVGKNGEGKGVVG